LSGGATFTVGGRYLATGSSSLTSPGITISASSAVLKVLVIEPISKTEFLSSATYHNRPEILKAVRDSGLRAVEARGNRL